LSNRIRGRDKDRMVDKIMRGKNRMIAIALLICAGMIMIITTSTIECAGASSAISVTPPTVNISFDSPTKDTFTADSTVTITNNGENATNVSIIPRYDFLIITPCEFTLNSGEPRQITIEADKSANEGSYTVRIITDTDTETSITVNIIYCAKITVSTSHIDFGEVASTSTVSKEITLSEEYGYKTVSDVTITRISGENDWVKPSQSSGITVSSFQDKHIRFTLTPGPPDYSRRDNRYTWKFSIRSDSRCVTVTPATITIEARIMRPAKLGEVAHAKKLNLKFDKPRGTVMEYHRYTSLAIKNEGDEPMTVRITRPPPLGGYIHVDAPSKVTVAGRDTKELKLHITAPYDAPEGTYKGILHLDAGKAGKADVVISVVVIWPVDFNISSSSPYFSYPPLSIDFGSLQLKDRGYEQRRLNLTLTEYYRYKPVRNLRLYAEGEYSNWLKERHDFALIPPGESRNITIVIQPGLEAVPKQYSWTYYLSAREISAKRVQIRAKIVPLNIPEMIKYLDAFRESQLHRSYPSSEYIISNGTELLRDIERSEIGVEDWRKIPVLIRATLSLLDALNDSIIHSANRDYDHAVENLLAASVSTSTISSNSLLNNDRIFGYATEIAASADRTTREVVREEAKMLELRAWSVKKAVEHARDDISKLKEDENVLESALCYQHAATLYGLLNERQKRQECIYEKSKMMDWHDELVSDATDLRIRAEGIISDSRERDLVRVWNRYLLLNPYNYDTFSTSYETAEGYFERASHKYRLAGESLLYRDTISELKELEAERSSIISLFFFSCILYAIIFLYALNRIVRGTMAYLKDTYEREIGDIMVNAG